MADALAGMCADLCMEQVEPEQALERIQEKALEQLVSLLDTRILSDAEAMDSCLGLIAEECGRIACEALEKGMARLREGWRCWRVWRAAKRWKGWRRVRGGSVN